MNPTDPSGLTAGHSEQSAGKQPFLSMLDVTSVDDERREEDLQRPARRVGIVTPRLTALSVLALIAINWNEVTADPRVLTSWALFVGALMLAVLVHELGHFTVGTLLGLDDLIIRVGPLFGYCSSSLGDDDFLERLTPPRQIVMAGAGPVANLVTFVVAHNLLTNPSPVLHGNSDAWFFLRVLQDVSLVMGLINSLPIGPLDGGRIVRALLSCLPRRARRSATRAFKVFSISTSSVWFVHLLVSRQSWPWLALGSVFLAALIVFSATMDAPVVLTVGKASNRSGSSDLVANPRWSNLALIGSALLGSVAGHLVGLWLYGA